MVKKRKELSYNQSGNEIVNNMTGAEIKKATINTVSAISGWSADTYTPQENLKLNSALFFALPILHAGIIVRANYSLGVPFVFKDEKDFFSAEEKYLNSFARRIGLSKELIPLSIHLDVYGNGYWHIEKNEAEEIIGITRIQPERVNIKLNEFGEIDKYLISLPNYTNKQSKAPIEIDPSEIIHFKERNWTEYPYGNSLISPIIDLCITRLDMNKITSVIYKSYAKPYRHLIYTPQEGDTEADVKAIVDSMVDTLQYAEPDSDLITTNSWSSNSLSATSGKNEEKFLEDVDKQILFQIAIPRFFYDPVGSTDLGINKSDMWFLKQMKNRQEYVAQVILERIFLPQLDLIFPNSDNIPLMEFIDDYDRYERRKEIIQEYKENIIIKNEARKELGYEELEEVKENMGVNGNEQAIKKIRFKDENIELYEKWQNGEMSDDEFLKKAKK
jgi:hypothetical protein